MVNGAVIFSSSRGHKSVSLSSADSMPWRGQGLMALTSRCLVSRLGKTLTTQQLCLYDRDAFDALQAWFPNVS